MRNMKWVMSFVFVALIAMVNTVSAGDEKPSATLSINEKQVGFLLTGDWGHGTLTYQGEPHMFHMGGAKIGGIGVSSMKVDGSVYNLNKLEDFEGIYFKADAGLTLAKGKVGSWLKNGNGVVIHLGANSDGVALQIGVEGLKMSF